MTSFFPFGDTSYTNASLLYVDRLFTNGVTLNTFKVTPKNCEQFGVSEQFPVLKNFGRDLLKQEQVCITM